MKIENAIPGCKSLVRSSGQCGPVAEIERLREVLTLIRDRTDGETCPVCSAVHALAKEELADNQDHDHVSCEMLRRIEEYEAMRARVTGQRSRQKGGE